MSDLVGKTAIVTGASRGMGAATARVLAGLGVNLVLFARNGAALAQECNAIRETGGTCETCTGDVAQFEDIARAVALAKDRFGGVDILINNAAVIDPIGHMAEIDPAEWAASMQINLTGMFYAMRAVLPVMQAQRHGVIVNISSGAAHGPLEGWSGYCAAKAGAFMLTRCAHLENSDSGVRVMSLSPGTVATDMQRKIKASGVNPVSQMDFAEHSAPERPARLIAWLTTDAAADLAGDEVRLSDPAIRARAGID